ncbi:MAG TPA: response regulator [Candidatus Xenobia bacterium]
MTNDEAQEERDLLAHQLESRFREPMNRILGLAEQLWETDLTAVQREDVALLRQHGGEMVSVINDCLDFTGLHHLALDHIPFNLRDTLANTLNQARIEWQLGEDSMILQAPDDVPDEVVGDPGRVRQVVRHALHLAMARRPVPLVLRARSEAHSASDVEVEVEVEVEPQPDAEERRPGMVSLPQSPLTRRVNDQLIALMGGKTVEADGVSVRFRLRFQLPNTRVKVNPSGDLAHLHGMSILVVGEDDVPRRQLERILRSWHMYPVSVPTLAAAQEALRRENAEPFKAVLVDASIPAAEALLAPHQLNSSTPRPRFIRLTWVGWRGEAAGCRAAGYHGYLTRPITQSDLFDALVTAMAHGDAEVAAPPLVTRHLLRETRRPLDVLVAEDNRMFQSVIRFLLEDRGYRVHTTCDGAEAVDWYRDHHVDLMLMDIQMPHMNGLEATEEIRKLEHAGGGRHVPIVAVTANTTAADRERCIQAGMDGYVSKPIYPQQLLTAIDEALGVGVGLTAYKKSGESDIRLRDDIEQFFTAVSGLSEDIKTALRLRDSVKVFTATCRIQELLESLPAPSASQTATQLALLSQDGRWGEASDVFRHLLTEVEGLRPNLSRLAREERVRILLAEDDEISRMILEDMLLSWGYEVIAVEDGTQALDVLNQEDPPRLAVLDWMMPGMDGLQVCREVRSRRQEPYIYLLLLTARFEKEDIVEGLDAGADDYLVKPVDGHEFKVRLRAGRRVLDLQEELISAREVLRLQATRDPLTGLLNRGAILDLMTAELSRQRRQRLPLSVLMLDIDHFKVVNDTHGHQAGDAVLRETARRMRSTIRPYDGIGRYGGEEFIVVLPGADTAGVEKIAARVRRRLDEEPMLAGDKTLHVTASFGIANSLEMSEPDVASLIRAADMALYRAKHNGRNRVETAIASDYAAPTEVTPA